LSNVRVLFVKYDARSRVQRRPGAGAPGEERSDEQNRKSGPRKGRGSYNVRHNLMKLGRGSYNVRVLERSKWKGW